MGWMEKGFWVAAGGLAGLALGGMLFDDEDLRSSRRNNRSVRSNQESDAITYDEMKPGEPSRNLKVAMEKIGSSLDETMEALKLMSAGKSG